MNASVTVRYGDSEVTFELDGIELSNASVDGHLYLSNASRAFVADEVERALKEVTKK
jgi:hypothetical protein